MIRNRWHQRSWPMRVRFIVLAITTIFACSLLTEFGPVRAEGGTAMYGLARKVKDCRSECEKGNQCLDFCPHKCAGACADLPALCATDDLHGWVEQTSGT